jgi:adenylate kinase family enzyme
MGGKTPNLEGPDSRSTIRQTQCYPRFMRVAVFGKPGGGKSTLSVKIAEATRLPLYQLDLIQFKAGGVKVSDDVFAKLHAEILAQRHWVLDGFGAPSYFEAMLGAADVLVYVERAALVHYWWVTKRFLKSPFVKPLGWPEGSPMWRSTLSSYQFLKLSRRFWTPALKAKLLALQPGKRVYVIHHRSEETALLKALKILVSAQ